MIEIMRAKATHIYRVNPLQPRCIDKRVNRHGARWEHYRHFDTAAEATEYLLQLGKKVEGTA